MVYPRRASRRRPSRKALPLAEFINVSHRYFPKRSRGRIAVARAKVRQGPWTQQTCSVEEGGKEVKKWPSTDSRLRLLSFEIEERDKRDDREACFGKLRAVQRDGEGCFGSVTSAKVKALRGSREAYTQRRTSGMTEVLGDEVDPNRCAMCVCVHTWYGQPGLGGLWSRARSATGHRWIPSVSCCRVSIAFKTRWSDTVRRPNGMRPFTRTTPRLGRTLGAARRCFAWLGDACFCIDGWGETSLETGKRGNAKHGGRFAFEGVSRHERCGAAGYGAACEEEVSMWSLFLNGAALNQTL